MSLIGIAAATTGCAGTMHTQPKPQPLAWRIDPTGVTPRLGAVKSGSWLRFVNNDSRPHEIYSNDCRELASTPIPPGQVFTAQLDLGPKLCHFQDLLSPTAPEFWGTVEVAEPPSANDFGSGS